MKIQVTIDEGKGGELRDHVMDRETLEMILHMAAGKLTDLQRQEKKLPPAEEEALRIIREIQYKWKMA